MLNEPGKPPPSWPRALSRTARPHGRLVVLYRDDDIERALKVLAKAEMEISAEPWLHVVWNPSKGAMINRNEALVKNLLLHESGQPLSPTPFDLKGEYDAALGEAKSSYRI